MCFVYLWASFKRRQLHDFMLAVLHRYQICVILSFLHGVLLLKLTISLLACVGLSYTGVHYLNCGDIEFLLA